MLDYPTAWEIQARGVTHTDQRCSAAQSGGAFLCDCGAVEAEWGRLREFRSLLDASSLGTPGARALIESTPPEVAARIVARADELQAEETNTDE